MLRCLQTAQEACNALSLPGIFTNNSVCEALIPGSKMKEAPVVPLPQEDLKARGISILQHDTNPMPAFPEAITDSLQRLLPAHLFIN